MKNINHHYEKYKSLQYIIILHFNIIINHQYEKKSNHHYEKQIIINEKYRSVQYIIILHFNIIINIFF
jgi:hypothetical protein